MRIDRNYLDVAHRHPRPPPRQWSTDVDNTTVGRVHRQRELGHVGLLRPAVRHRLPVRRTGAVQRRRLVPGEHPGDRSYEISVWYPADAGYNNPTPFIVATTSGNQTVRSTSGSTAGSGCRSACSRSPAGHGDKVGVSRWTSGTGYVIADAVRITRVVPAPVDFRAPTRVTRAPGRRAEGGPRVVAVSRRPGARPSRLTRRRRVPRPAVVDVGGVVCHTVDVDIRRRWVRAPARAGCRTRPRRRGCSTTSPTRPPGPRSRTASVPSTRRAAGGPWGCRPPWRGRVRGVATR